MKKFFLLLIALNCVMVVKAEEKFDLAKGYEAGKAYYAKYDNPQCRGLRVFLQNTGSSYRMAYKGQKSLKSADDFTRYESIETIRKITEQGLPLPFNMADLIQQSSIVREKIFKNQYENSDQYLDSIYHKCITALNKSAYSNNDNYERVLDYSKGEDKIYRPKITKVEQVCDREDFPALMEKARGRIKDFASNRNQTTDQFLSAINYKSLNRLAEDMLQANLDDGTINHQFLLYASGGIMGKRIGNLPPRCSINR
ncbi:hypothetical protein [Acinetobacter bereziniae]|uniref:hypothetical protein n=1 Tax=Acinetobacter bereziniae TaxID=106648 RepID=UPI00124FC4D6|nr:hypothetical protein [Acinetobacter bereziniae]